MKERKALSHLARTRYPSYARLIMQDLHPGSSWKLLEFEFLRFIFLYLEDFVNKEERNLVINLPPSFFKTTLIVLMAVFLYLRDGARILILVRTDEARMRLMANVMMVLTLPRTKILFPEMKSRRVGKSVVGRNGARITIQLFKTLPEETLQDFILVDDPEPFIDPEHVDADAEKYISQVMRPTSEANSVLMLSARVGKRDASKMMVEWFGATHLKFGAVFLDDEKLTHKAGVSLQQKKLRMLCPEMMTWERFTKTRRGLDMWDVCYRYLSHSVESPWTPRCSCALWAIMMATFGEIMTSTQKHNVPEEIYDSYTAARKEE